jgi:hypothetical protein
MLVFSPQLCELLPLKPSLWFTSPPPPLPEVKVQNIRTVCGWKGGVLSCVGDHILQEFNTLFLTCFKQIKRMCRMSIEHLAVRPAWPLGGWHILLLVPPSDTRPRCTCICTTSIPTHQIVEDDHAIFAVLASVQWLHSFTLSQTTCGG